MIGPLSKKCVSISWPQIKLTFLWTSSILTELSKSAELQLTVVSTLRYSVILVCGSLDPQNSSFLWETTALTSTETWRQLKWTTHKSGLREHLDPSPKLSGTLLAMKSSHLGLKPSGMTSKEVSSTEVPCSLNSSETRLMVLPTSDCSSRAWRYHLQAYYFNPGEWKNRYCNDCYCLLLIGKSFSEQHEDKWPSQGLQSFNREKA